MASTKKTIKNKIVHVKDISRGDVIAISEDVAPNYLVIDVGDPFCLLEDLDSGFCSLYHPKNSIVYKSKN